MNQPGVLPLSQQNFRMTADRCSLPAPPWPNRPGSNVPAPPRRPASCARDAIGGGTSIRPNRIEVLEYDFGKSVPTQDQSPGGGGHALVFGQCLSSLGMNLAMSLTTFSSMPA